jgi:hypothetical protein
MKVKLQLQTVVNLQRDIEDKIVNYEDSIVRHNTELNVDSLLTTMLKLQDQLIIVKEVIQTANKGKNSEGKTNNYFIYKKSNLEKFKKFLRKLKDAIGKNDENAHINSAEIDQKKKATESEIKNIQTKLDKFNDSKTVSVEFDESIVDLFPILQDVVKKK